VAAPDLRYVLEQGEAEQHGIACMGCLRVLEEGKQRGTILAVAGNRSRYFRMWTLSPQAFSF
jgi:hypothetical protein